MESGDRFLFIEDLELIIVSHQNTMHQSNIEQVFNELDAIPIHLKHLKILIDVRQSDIKIKSEEIENLGSLIFENLEHRNIEKRAILVGKQQINKVVEFVRAYKHSSKYQVFDNFEGAFRWLKIPVDRNEQLKTEHGR